MPEPRRHALLLAAFLLFVLAPRIAAQEDETEEVLAGHSGHGEAFNEGPRQQAYLIDGCGDVSFPVSCTKDRSQKFMDQGVAQLHGFWYFEAERSFRQVVALEPGCAMAYWGLAMANVDNPDRATGFIEAAVRRRANATPRERMWIDSLAKFYEVTPESAAQASAARVSAAQASAAQASAAQASGKNETKAREESLPAAKKDEVTKAGSKPTDKNKRTFKRSKKDRSRDLAKSYAAIVKAFPDDIEAAAFSVNRTWLNRRAQLPTKNHKELEKTLVRIFAENPMHPAHHYRIHLWDRKDAKRALKSAALSGQAAPAIAHQWHMSGHIFAKLHRHEDAVWQQDASARVDHAHMMRDRVMPHRINNFGHNNEWLVRSLNHVGRVRDALALAQNMLELPRHPKKNSVGKSSSIAGYGTSKFIETCRKYGMLDELIDFSEHGFLGGGENARTRLRVAADLGAAFFEMGDVARGKAQLAAVRGLAKASDKTPAPKRRDGGSRPGQGQRGRDQGDQKDQKDQDEGGQDSAKSGERRRGQSSRRRGGRSRRSTSRRRIQELEGLLALAEGRKDDARAKLKSTSMPKLFRADARLALGDVKDARKIIDAEAKRYPNRAEIMARRVRILHASGDDVNARKVFDRLRTVAGNGDLDVPLFRRLAGIAREFGYPTDWRTPRVLPTDVGERPPLDTLGPFRWHPVVAKDWQLTATDGTRIGLKKNYEGRPVLVVFYLGFGCLHCVEQLQAFHPMAEAFRKSGIEIVAIGTDSVAGMCDSLADMAAADRFAFPLVSDQEMNVFKEWRAFDDFEDMPLHGTFLVDGQGNIRWQDISYEPFNQPEWLLAECKRLLAQKRRVR